MKSFRLLGVSWRVVLCVVALSVLPMFLGGCDPDPATVDAAISASVAHSTSEAARVRTAALALPDGDSRKAAALAYANGLDTEARKLTERVTGDKKSSDQWNIDHKYITDIGDAIPITGASLVVGGVMGIWKSIDDRKKAAERLRLRLELEAKAADAESIVHSLESAKATNPSFAAAFNAVAPQIVAVQTDGAHALVDAAQEKRATVLASVGATQAT